MAIESVSAGNNPAALSITSQQARETPRPQQTEPQPQATPRTPERTAEQAQQAQQVQQARQEARAEPPPKPVVNVQGQVTGGRINVTA